MVLLKAFKAPIDWLFGTPWVLNSLRTAVQAAWGTLTAHFTILNAVPAQQAIDFILTVIVIGGITAALRWAESRTGNTWWEKLARTIGKWAMFGLSKKQPTYATPETKTA